MTIQELGSIGEFISALFVVVSLLYLAFQVRQNTSSLKASGYQEAVRGANEWSSYLVNHPETSDLLLRGLADRSSLADPEKVEFDHLLFILLRNYSGALYLARAGFIPASICGGYEAAVRQFLQSEQMRDWWRRNERIFEQGFVDHMRKLLAA